MARKLIINGGAIRPTGLLFTFGCYEKLVDLVLHMSPFDEGHFHFGAPGTPGFYVRAQHDPEKNT